MKDKLIESGSEKALQQNIKTEIEAGKDPKQAAAIAYSVQRANDATTAELLYCVIEFTESDYYGLTSRVGKQITLDTAETLIKNADMAYQAKNKPGYDKTYLDLYVRYNGHKYRIHLLRFYIGDGQKYMNVKEKVKDVLKRVPELVNDNRYITYNYVKKLDADIKPALYRHNNGQVYKSNEIKAQYELEKPNMDLMSWINANFTRINDGYTGEIRNISGKQFKGADGKIYEMPNNTYAMYCPQQNAYYGFKNDNNMPYAPVGGKQALRQILGDGGFISLDGMIFVKPIRDANTVLKEYSKFENSRLETAQLIKHNNGYTFVASNPKDDKDSNSLQQLEQYILGKGYKPIY